MPVRCSICQHPQRNSIDVSLVRDGTRCTARQFQVSRPADDHRWFRHTTLNSSRTMLSLRRRDDNSRSKVQNVRRDSSDGWFHGQTPDEMYFGSGDAVPEDLLSRAAAARRTRVEANRSASCEICPSALRGRVTMEC
jgi:hypothetical protein